MSHHQHDNDDHHPVSTRTPTVSIQYLFFVLYRIEYKLININIKLMKVVENYVQAIKVWDSLDSASQLGNMLGELGF